MNGVCSFRLLVLAALLQLPMLCQSAELQPFTSDGCSAFPDGTFTNQALWLACCQAHDYAYWQGGTYQQRLEADEALRECVAQVGQEEIGLVMLAGVRIGGTPILPTQFRWGYGWPYPRWYGPLSLEEQQQIREAQEQGSILPSPSIELDSVAPKPAKAIGPDSP